VVECRGKKVASEVLLLAAENRPLTKEVLAGQLGRLGGTGYQLGVVQNLLEGEVMMPLGELNRVRRRLVEELKEEPVVHDGKVALARFLPERGEVEDSLPELRVLCRTLDQVHGCARAGATFVYCDFEDLKEYREAVGVAKKAGMKVFLATPRIQKPMEAGFFKMVEKAEPDGVLVRNLGGVSYFKERGIPMVADFSLNVANQVSAGLLMEHGGFENLTVSYDLNEGQVGELVESAPPGWFELTVHQHMPMFHMEHCVFCTFMSEGTSIKDCGKPCDKHSVQLRDRVGQLHILKADVGCRNTLFNGRAQTGAGSVDEFVSLGLRKFRVELLEEDAKQAARLVTWYRDFLGGKGDAQDLVRKLGAIERLGVTKGTLEKMRGEVHR
jgi:putative protease